MSRWRSVSGPRLSAIRVTQSRSSSHNSYFPSLSLLAGGPAAAVVGRAGRRSGLRRGAFTSFHDLARCEVTPPKVNSPSDRRRAAPIGSQTGPARPAEGRRAGSGQHAGTSGACQRGAQAGFASGGGEPALRRCAGVGRGLALAAPGGGSQLPRLSDEALDLTYGGCSLDGLDAG